MKKVTRVICPRCKGKGFKANIDWGMAILSLGATALIDLSMADRCQCKVCDGRGYLLVEDAT